MSIEPTVTSTGRQPDRTMLVIFVALLVTAGASLALIAGPPRWPAGLPPLERVPAMLGGSVLPLDALAALLLDAAWLVWLWIVASLGVQILLAAAEALAHGATWVRSARYVADRCTLPLARRAVAAAFVLQVLGRGVPLAHAAPIIPPEVTLATTPAEATASAQLPPAEAAAAETYLVRPGDTLWSIAERAYGSGTAYRRVLAANLGRRMGDGRVLDARGVIQPGWQLVVPAPGPVERADGVRWYTVVGGDTLSAIAATVLGDEARWPELFELNRGLTTPDGMQPLSDPDVIWPGLRLQLPAEQSGVAPTAAESADDVTDSSAVTPAQPRTAVELGVASATPPARADNGYEMEAAAASGPPADDLDSLPPLLRTPHALDPIALEPVDAPEAQPEPAPTATDTVTGAPDADRTSSRPIPDAALASAGVAGLAGVVILGATGIRRLRRMSSEPETDVVVDGGFAAAELATAMPAGRVAAYDPVAAVVARFQRFVADYNLSQVAVVAVRHGRSATTLTVAAGLAEQGLVLDLAPVFAAELEAEVDAWCSADHDVALRLRLSRKTRLLPAADGAPGDAACLVPLGVLYDRQILSAAWERMGHVLVASEPGHGADTIVTSLLASLTARCSPVQLRLLLIARPRALPAALRDLPHVKAHVDPDDGDALAELVERVRAAAAAPGDPLAGVTIVVSELASLGEHGPALELLTARESSSGIRLIAATSQPRQALLSPLRTQFNTRMVLRMADEESSVGLLGVADAAFLGGGGRLLLRLDGREPVELYGYQVAADHLERLARVMRVAHAPTRATEAAEAAEPSQAAPPPEPVPPAPPTETPLSPIAELVVEPTEVAAPLNPAPSPAPAPIATDPPAATAIVAPPSRAPIEVICFGPPRVLCAGVQVWPRVGGGEAKPWEFLLYLGCQPPEGVASEQAVEALWPEDDADDPSHRFRQLRYRLRQALAHVPGAPSSDGICLDRHTLRLDPAIVRSDAADFLDLVRAARTSIGAEAIPFLTQARALYTGDLLEGPDARRYAWLDERDGSGVTLREHFRRQFQQASTRLAELHVAGGAFDCAEDIYHELTAVDPGDERLWRALFRMHAARADRPALIREERRMRALLRELNGDAIEPADDVEAPSHELALEYRRLLDGLHEADREPVQV